MARRRPLRMRMTYSARKSRTGDRLNAVRLYSARERAPHSSIRGLSNMTNTWRHGLLVPLF